MVAYSFKARFAGPIVIGRKQQTIRAERKRHARPGEQLQLYKAMRTRQCSLIGRATCLMVVPVRLDFLANFITIEGTHICFRTAKEIDNFAHLDGFANWDDMAAFWKAEHADLPVFSGILIGWKDFRVPDDA
jgi:uncharacterized protein YqfB (UPF0267 family)